MARTNTFHKSQRLCSHYLIDKLFEPGSSSSLSAFPLRVVYRLEYRNADLHSNTQMLISVPKRYFKHAVDRNRVKRQVREAYRTNLSLLSLPEDRIAYIAFIWLDAKHHPSSEVTSKVCNLLQRISERTNNLLQGDSINAPQ